MFVEVHRYSQMFVDACRCLYEFVHCWQWLLTLRMKRKVKVEVQGCCRMVRDNGEC